MKNAMQLKAIMKQLAKENQISAQLVLQNYMLERFLERVSLSPYRDNYIIKGGFLISSMVGLNSRATMDMDATIKGYPVTQDAVQKMIEKILTVSVDDDITFTFKSIIDDFGWPRNPDGYNALVKRVAKKAGLKDIHPHMFRHTFVSLLMSNPDIGVATVAAEAGHAQPSTTLMIYTQQYKKRRESIRNQLSRELYEK